MTIHDLGGCRDADRTTDQTTGVGQQIGDGQRAIGGHRVKALPTRYSNLHIFEGRDEAADRIIKADLALFDQHQH